MKVSFWGKENKKTAKCYFQDKCISLQKLTGFPTVATPGAATSGHHAVTTGESNAWAQGRIECSSQLCGRHVGRPKPGGNRLPRAQENTELSKATGP